MKKINSIFLDFAPTGKVGIHRELAEFLRRRIEGGELPAGTLIPSQRGIAATCRTNPFSVKLATDELVRSGHLNKQPGRGMFVAELPDSIRCVAIYTSDGRSDLNNIGFRIVLREMLCRRLQAAGIGYELFFDCRPETEHNAPPERLRRGIADGTFQAVLGTWVRSYDQGWFHKLPVRHLTMMFDPRPDYLPAATALKDCKRIAAVLPTRGNHDDSVLLVQFKEAGIHLRPKRVRLIHESEQLAGDYSEIGYRHVRELLSSPTVPDGLIVYPDTAVPGAVMAILERGLAVPGELSLVFHRNREIPVFVPFPVCWLDTHIDKLAKDMIRELLGKGRK